MPARGTTLHRPAKPAKSSSAESPKRRCERKSRPWIPDCLAIRRSWNHGVCLRLGLKQFRRTWKGMDTQAAFIRTLPRKPHPECVERTSFHAPVGRILFCGRTRVHRKRDTRTFAQLAMSSLRCPRVLSAARIAFSPSRESRAISTAGCFPLACRTITWVSREAFFTM
jgi:hypothetical protein